MQVQIPALVGPAHLLRVDLMEPVLLGKGFPDVIVHAVDALLGVGVFLDAPIVFPQVVAEHLDGSADEGIGFPGAPAFFPIQNIGLGGFCVAVFDEHFFYDILDTLYIRNVVPILTLRNGYHLVR